MGPKTDPCGTPHRRACFKKGHILYAIGQIRLKP